MKRRKVTLAEYAVIYTASEREYEARLKRYLAGERKKEWPPFKAGGK